MDRKRNFRRLIFISQRTILPEREVESRQSKPSHPKGETQAVPPIFYTFWCKSKVEEDGKNVTRLWTYGHRIYDADAKLPKNHASLLNPRLLQRNKLKDACSIFL